MLGTKGKEAGNPRNYKKINHSFNTLYKLILCISSSTPNNLYFEKMKISGNFRSLPPKVAKLGFLSKNPEDGFFASMHRAASMDLGQIGWGFGLR